MSQCDQILEMLKAGVEVTPFTVYDWTGSLAAHSRIAELRARGYHIDKVMRRANGRIWGEYRLVGQSELAL